MATPLPTVFLGHGTPMYALGNNPFADGWAALGKTLPRPKSILCISAHWYIRGSALTISTSPETIHDFGGFPQALFDIRYPAPGDPKLARRVQQLLAPRPVDLTEKWGYDHGTWSVMRHLFPKADVPLVQLSIDGMRDASYHYEIGQRLAPLRDEGVLIVGSGNIVHNLRNFVRNPGFQPFEWAARFDARAKELMQAKDHAGLIHYETLGSDARLAVPTPDHYFPLMYVLGAGGTKAKVQFPVEGIDGGSMSMRAVLIG